MLHSVLQVIPRKDFKVYVYFNTGEVKLFDMNHLLNKGVFKQISNKKDFISKCTVLNHTLAWDIKGKFNPFECIDIDPETIFNSGKLVKDPLE